MASGDVSGGGLAGRYASALLALAEEGKSLDDVAGDLRVLETLIAESEDLLSLIRSPLYSREKQRSALDKILETAGAHQLTRRFVGVVAQNRRLFALPQMIRAYLSELARRRGEVTAEVTAARDLSEEERRRLAEALAESGGQKVQLDVKVDEGLIGGMVVRLGSRMIDSSLKSKLQRLELAMKGVG